MERLCLLWQGRWNGLPVWQGKWEVVPSVAKKVKQFTCLARSVKQFAWLASRLENCISCDKESETVHLLGKDCESVRCITVSEKVRKQEMCDGLLFYWRNVCLLCQVKWGDVTACARSCHGKWGDVVVLARKLKCFWLGIWVVRLFRQESEKTYLRGQGRKLQLSETVYLLRYWNWGAPAYVSKVSWSFFFFFP